MDDISIAFLEYLRKMLVETDQDFLREAIRVVSQGIIEAEAEQQIRRGPALRMVAGAHNLPERSSGKGLGNARGRDTLAHP